MLPKRRVPFSCGGPRGGGANLNEKGMASISISVYTYEIEEYEENIKTVCNQDVASKRVIKEYRNGNKHKSL
jgi:hypothetical protein